LVYVDVCTCIYFRIVDSSQKDLDVFQLILASYL